MKKRLMIAALVLSMLFLTGCFAEPNVVKETEDIDKSTRIVTIIDVKSDQNITTQELKYIKDEQMFTVYFPYKYREALDWLKTNSRPNDKVLSWWDNGHVLRGYARRNPLVYTPSRSILETLPKKRWDTHTLGEFSSEEDMTNVAYAFLSDSPTIIKGIMNRYDAQWVFVARVDQKKLEGMAMLMDEDPTSYLDDLGEPKSTVRGKILFKMGDGWTVKGFDHAYEDDYVNIYKVQE